MSEKKKDLLIYLGVGAVISLAVFALNMSRHFEFMRCLCDGFFVAAVMLMGLGGIKAVRNKGTFDVMGYGVKTALETALPFLRHGEEKENIHQYVERKAAERRGSAAMLMAGGVYLAASILALIGYHVI